MTSDVLALGLALGALALAQRPPTERHTFGFERAEVLAAQANGVLLLVGAIAIVIEAVRRLGTRRPSTRARCSSSACSGSLVNVGSAFVLGRAAHGNLNLRAAFWHLALDALGSLAVIVVRDRRAACSTRRASTRSRRSFIAVLIVFAAWRLLRDTTRVLLEAVPSDIDVAIVERGARFGGRASRRCIICTCGRWVRSDRRSRRTSCSPGR